MGGKRAGRLHPQPGRDAGDQNPFSGERGTRKHLIRGRFRAELCRHFCPMRSSGCDHGIEAPRCLQAPPPAWRAKGAEPGCRRIGDRLALHSAHQNINLSYRDLPYRDLPSRSDDPAAGLLAHGLKPGDRIGLKAHGQGPQLEFVSGIRQPPGHIYNRVKR